MMRVPSLYIPTCIFSIQASLNQENLGSALCQKLYLAEKSSRTQSYHHDPPGEQ